MSDIRTYTHVPYERHVYGSEDAESPKRGFNASYLRFSVHHLSIKTRNVVGYDVFRIAPEPHHGWRCGKAAVPMLIEFSQM